MASAAQTYPGGLAQGAGRTENQPNQGSTENLSPSTVNRILMEYLIYIGRTLVVVYPIYLTGYLGLSISWVLLCMFMITWWQKNRQWKVSRIGSNIDFMENETNVINTELKSALQMATWVQFSNVEKVNWVNKMLEQAWPFFAMYMEKLLRQNIQPAIRLSNTALKTFTFTKIHFGHRPLQITGIRAYTDEVDQREVILDLNINYDSDVDIDTEMKPIIAGVKGLKFQGVLRVVLEPLIGQSPLVGGVTLFFIRRPTLEINWTGMTNLLDSPAFNSLSDNAIMDIIASLMVLPNRMCIPLIDQLKVDQMRFPLPRGVVRVHLLEARDLMAMDTYLMGLKKGKSDPYVTLRVGNRHFKSKTIKNTLDPKWNEVYQFVVHEAPGQELEMELYDEDTDKDDFLGSYNLDLGEVKREKQIDEWFTLERVKHGEVHLRLQWLSLQADPSLLRETGNSFACAMLAVYLDNATKLPKDQKEFSEHHRPGKPQKESRLTKKNTGPNSFVEFSIDQHVQKSKVVYASRDPAWEEGFTFFVQDVKTQQLTVQVKEHGKSTVLGVLILPLSRLLSISNMTLDQRFKLERSGAESEIKLKATLRVLCVEEPPPKPTVSIPPQVQQQTVPAPSSAAVSPASIPATSPPIQPPKSLNSSGDNDVSQRRGSFLDSDGLRSPPMAPMRRFDSHSLLSDNSIASSRLDISDGASYPEAIRNHQGSFGEIHLTIKYATLRNRLIIHVNSCRNLFACSESGTDSYVRLYLLPDQTWRHRKKTQVKKKTVNPVFNEKYEFDVSLEEARTRKLDVAVKNNKTFHTSERKDIGMVILELSQLEITKGITEWFQLTLNGVKNSN